MTDHNLDFAYSLGVPVARGRLRSSPEDFQVREVLGFPPEGAGEHVFLHVRKRNSNTEWVSRQIARVAGVSMRDVSYSGLKDKLALTWQWFSVHLPGKADPDWRTLESEQIHIEEIARHKSKLRHGTHQSNGFILTVREVAGDCREIDARLATIRDRGIPNYFGEQRFGNEGRNLEHALAMFQGGIKVKDRHLRGLYLSAARAWLFNLVLSRRVSAGTWDRLLPGEVLMLDGSNSFFLSEETDQSLEARLAAMDIHPTGPLWGRGDLHSRDVARELEHACSETQPILTAGLEEAGLRQERRKLRIAVPDLRWEWLDQTTLRLAFSLPRGCYATSLMREVISPCQ